MKRYFDKRYSFAEVFDGNTGFYLRTGILDEKGRDTGIDPFMRSFPSLLDIGIMGTCSTASLCKVGCYQQGKNSNLGHNMDLELFKRIIDEISGKTFEIALGGYGNPDQHERFREIVRYARKNDVVPNYTTSGLGLAWESVIETKNNCGAVAVSWHNSDYTLNAIDMFLAGDIKTNIHFVLGNDSIDEAIRRLEEDDFPKDINAVIFLLYKPVGKVKDGNVLKVSDPRVEKFYSLIDNPHPYKVGLDACHMPGVTNFSKNISPISTSACDAARFSMYISHDGFALPCSFDVSTRDWAVDIKNSTIENVWYGEVFEKWRLYHKRSCSSCSLRNDCLGGCPIAGKEINLCSKSEIDYYEN